MDEGSSPSPSALFESANAVTTLLRSARSHLLTISTKHDEVLDEYSPNVKISLVIASVTPKVSHNARSTMKMSSEIGFGKKTNCRCIHQRL